MLPLTSDAANVHKTQDHGFRASVVMKKGKERAATKTFFKSTWGGRHYFVLLPGLEHEDIPT